MDFTSNEKYAIVAVLSSIMKADGVIEPDEQALMDKIYRSLGININDFPIIAALDVDDCKRILKDMPEQKKEHVQKCFLEMVGVDGHVDLR